SIFVITIITSTQSRGASYAPRESIRTPGRAPTDATGKIIMSCTPASVARNLTAPSIGTWGFTGNGKRKFKARRRGRHQAGNQIAMGHFQRMAGRTEPHAARLRSQQGHLLSAQGTGPGCSRLITDPANPLISRRPTADLAD